MSTASSGRVCGTPLPPVASGDDDGQSVPTLPSRFSPGDDDAPLPLDPIGHDPLAANRPLRSPTLRPPESPAVRCWPGRSPRRAALWAGRLGGDEPDAVPVPASPEEPADPADSADASPPTPTEPPPTPGADAADAVPAGAGRPGGDPALAGSLVFSGCVRSRRDVRRRGAAGDREHRIGPAEELADAQTAWLDLRHRRLARVHPRPLPDRAPRRGADEAPRGDRPGRRGGGVPNVITFTGFSYDPRRHGGSAGLPGRSRRGDRQLRRGPESDRPGCRKGRRDARPGDAQHPRQRDDEGPSGVLRRFDRRLPRHRQPGGERVRRAALRHLSRFRSCTAT